MSRKKSSLLPSLNYKRITSLVLLLLVTHTTPSSQTPLEQLYDCPRDCECNEQTFSARCNDIDALINAYSIKHPTEKNFMPIKILDLSNNQLTKISNHLELLVNLTELNLSHNRLTQVHKLHFDHLEKLDLSHNRITSGKLSKLPKNVIQLDLANNEITYLPSDFMKLKKLRSLELSENPLNCTCETLMIRNWIQYQHVWTDKAIVCASPQIFKGQPWVQARQNDICIESLSTTTRPSIAASKYNWDEMEDENDVMMGDQPATDDDDDGEAHTGPSLSSEHIYDDKQYEDEDDKDEDIFNNPNTPSSLTDENTADEDVSEENELKKDEFIPLESTTKGSVEHVSSTAVDEEKQNEEEENKDEGSGGMSAPKIDLNYSEGSGDDDGSGGFSSIIFGSTTSLGIFNDEVPSEAPSDTISSEAPLNTNLQKAGVDASTGEKKNEEIKNAQVDDNTGTFILLAVIGILLGSLIIFVAMKNRQDKRKSRRGYDVEKDGRNGGTELQDMDKRLLGKPIEKNGNGKHENSPLINNHESSKEGGFKPYTPPAITVDEPVQELPQKEKLQNNSHPNGNGNTFEPIEPVHTTPSNGDVPKSPDSDEEVFHPASENPESLNATPEVPKRYSPIYNPVSPRSARYSPVYSPETGRVKIKLTETPKPKTPVVVTRSRSRAGDYVNTPNN